MSKVQELANEAAACFYRDDETREWAVREDCPIWIDNLVDYVCGKRSADKYIYEYVNDVLDGMAYQDPDIYEVEPGDSDAYISDLLEWAGSSAWRYNGYMDDALSEYGDAVNFFELLQLGQMKEREEVRDLVVEFLQENASALETEDEEE